MPTADEKTIKNKHLYDILWGNKKKMKIHFI